MPLPWKKVKSTRISMFVNDHLHNSQRRRDGSSLVVETGFPTSLVDLFIKNREKWKKTPKKKRQSQPITPTPDAEDSPIPDSAGSLSSSLSSSGHTVTPIVEKSLDPLICSCAHEVVAEEVSNGESFVAAAEKDSNSSSICLVVLKLFLVVFLVLGTDRLTVGITVSAFLLFFLDYVGRYVCGIILKPCSRAKGLFTSVLQSVCRLQFLKEPKVNNSKDTVLMPELEQKYRLKHCSSLKNPGLRCPFQEIQIVEPNNHLAMEKEEYIQEAAELKRKSNRAKMKSTMKKLFLKRSTSSQNENDPRSRDQLNQFEHESGSETASEFSSISSPRYMDDDGFSAISSGVLLEDKKEGSNMKTEARQNRRYLVLVLIILVGLVGGRPFAILLTLIWCLLLKFGNFLRPFKDKSRLSARLYYRSLGYHIHSLSFCCFLLLVKCF